MCFSHQHGLWFAGGPQQQGRVPSAHLTQDHHHCCPRDRQVLCFSTPSLSQPPGQGICQDLHFSKGWSTADQADLPKYIRHKFLLDSDSQHLPHQLHTRSIPTSHRGHWPSRPANKTFPDPGNRPAFTGPTHTWDQLQGAPQWAERGSQSFI